MRILTGCLLIAASALAMAPNSEELHKWYGEPYMERFIARPGVSVLVEYGSDRSVCAVSIGPPRSIAHPEELGQPFPLEGLSEVIEEIAPQAMRGREINSGSYQTSCAVGHMTNYENVYIERESSVCGLPSYENELGARIFFKRDICPKPSIPLVTK
jgi:hypothetical protein